MRERIAREVRVDERDGTADLRQTEPDRHIVGAIRHEEADGGAWLQPLLQSPARIAMGQINQRAIGQRAIFPDQRKVLAFRGDQITERRQ